MKPTKYLIIIGIIIGLAGCHKNGTSVKHIPHLGDTPYQEDSVLVTYAHDPGRAFVLLDSALLLGNVSDYRSQFIRAKIYSKSLIEQQYDSAINICVNLLKHDSVVSSPHEQENVLELLMNASRGRHDFEAYMKWATQRAEVCRQQGEETERWRTEAEIGMLMTHLGQSDEGMAKIEESIRQLDTPGSIDRLDAFIIAVKRKISVLNDQGHYAEVIPLAQRILDRLDHYVQHASDYAEDSYRLSWSDHPADRDRYIDFSRAQANGFLAIAYAMTGDTSQARECLGLFDESGYGKTYAARRMIIPAQMGLGQYDEAMATSNEIVRRMGCDTLNLDYAAILRDQAVVARAKGRLADAYSLMTRYSALSKTLSDSLHAGEAHEYAARYHAKEQEMQIQEAENANRIKNIIIGIVVLLFVIAGAVSNYYRRQRQIISEKNRALVRMINGTPLELPDDEPDVEDDAHPESEPSVVANDSADLFSRIDATIRSERLYADANLQRQVICDRFGISRHALNDLFTQHADGLSFPQYINNIRMKEAIRLLKDNTDMTISAIAQKVGFKSANFREQFKQKYGMTPAEYRQNS